MSLAVAYRLLAVTMTCIPVVGCGTSEFLVANAPNVFARVQLHLDLPYDTDRRRRLDIIAPLASGLTGQSSSSGMAAPGMRDAKRATDSSEFSLAEQGIVAVADYRAVGEVLLREAIELRDALKRVHVPVNLELFPHRGHADTVASFAMVTRRRTPALQDVVRFIRAVSGTVAANAVTLFDTESPNSILYIRNTMSRRRTDGCGDQRVGALPKAKAVHLW